MKEVIRLRYRGVQESVHSFPITSSLLLWWIEPPLPLLFLSSLFRVCLPSTQSQADLYSWCHQTTVCLCLLFTARTRGTDWQDQPTCGVHTIWLSQTKFKVLCLQRNINIHEWVIHKLLLLNVGGNVRLPHTKWICFSDTFLFVTVSASKDKIAIAYSKRIDLVILRKFWEQD